MSGVWLAAGIVPAIIWVAVLCLPWQPWRTRERLEAADSRHAPDLSDVTVLIPARDEAAVLPDTLAALKRQGAVRVIVVDEQSTDGTGHIAHAAGVADLAVIAGRPLPPGWTGKLWALEQGRGHVKSRFVLLLDADIALAPGTLSALLHKALTDDRQLVSLMAHLRMHSFWERLLMPAFIYFFKLIYPFALSNRGVSLVAAAAGGCVLLETGMLERIGGFGALRNALIDDCTLAQKVQQASGRTWLGLSHSATSLRRYDTLGPIWQMVTRTAYTQLNYSPLWLALCTLMFGLSFGLPWVALIAGPGPARIAGGVALAASMFSFVPVLRYYGLSVLRVLTLPLIALLYLMMTWDSALRYWRGERSRWRGRSYQRDGGGN